jgi:tetratricopeptide (TPR) repeat protein
MATKHISTARLLYFCDRECSAREAAAIQAHLKECSRCRRAYEEIKRGGELLLMLPRERLSEKQVERIWAAIAPVAEATFSQSVRPAAGPGGDDDTVVAPSTAPTTLAELEHQQIPVQTLLDELDALSPEEQELRVRSLRRYASVELSAAYVERSHAKRYSDHEDMLRIARLAVAVAEAATPADAGGLALLNDCRAKAWAELGNAHRIRSEVLEAEGAFARALHLIGEGTGDPGVRAFVLRLLSTLHIFRGDFGGAARLLEEVIAYYRQERDPTGEAAALISLAIARLHWGKPDLAIPVLQGALRLLTTQEIELLRAAVQNLVYCYLELGKPKLAYGLLADAEPHFLNCTDEAMLLRMNWLRGKIEKDLGLLHAAEVRMSRVRVAFLRQDLALQVAMVSLDLAEVYALQGRVPDLVRTVGETIPIFQGLQVTRDLLASLLKLREIASSQAAAVALLRKVAAQVRLEAGDSKASAIAISVHYHATARPRASAHNQVADGDASRERQEPVPRASETRVDGPPQVVGGVDGTGEVEGGAFAAVERPATAASQRRRFSVQRLLAELDRLVPEQRELKVRNLRRYASPELSAAYVERSHAARYNDQHEMMDSARLAVAIAEAATAADAAGRADLNDCRARAWAQLGNAHRIRSEIAEAERAFGQALRLVAEGGDPRVRASILRLLSSLRFLQRDFQAAAALLEEVVDYYRDERDRAGEAGALVGLGFVRANSGQPEAAIPALQRSLRLLATQEIDLRRAAVQNLSLCYLELGEPKLAYGLMADAEPHYLTCTDETVLLRMNWLRGKIEKDLGLLHAAEVRLGRVREGFLRRDFPAEVAVVSLDLAEVYALQGRVPDLVRTVGETIPIFQGLRVTRDLLASLLKLREIASSQTAAIALLREVAAQVRGGLPQAEAGGERMSGE